MPKTKLGGMFEALQSATEYAQSWDEVARRMEQNQKAQKAASGTTADQNVSVSIVGRRHFWMLLGKAFDVLFEGRTTLTLRRKS